ncbi:MAG: glycosyltransferase [Candidatus Acidiferrales bacterium]
MTKLLREIRADFLLTLYGGGFSTMAYLSGFRPYAVYVVGSDVLLGGALKRIMSRVAFTRASAVFISGKHLTETARRVAPGANLHCLYLGTDVARFAPGNATPAPVRIVCTRGFAEIYNNEFLVRALAEMPALDVAYETIFAAPGPLLARIRILADQILTSERRKSVQFLGGVSKHDLTNVLKSSHIYVSVSRSDGTSSSLLEGLACGLFPVLSDIPANREWIFPGAQNGLLVPLDNHKALASALAQAIQNEALRVSAQSFNRKLVVDRADDRKNIGVLSNEIESLVRGFEMKCPQLDRIHE